MLPDGWTYEEVALPQKAARTNGFTHKFLHHGDHIYVEASTEERLRAIITMVNKGLANPPRPKPTCPRCGSEKVFAKYKTPTAPLVCRDCDYEFRP